MDNKKAGWMRLAGMALVAAGIFFLGLSSNQE